jgi:predicted nucleic acid-binding protein
MEKLKTILQSMQGQRVYFDTNGLIYFFDRNPLYFPVISEIIQAVDRGEIFGFTGDAVVSELMVFPYRSKNPAEIARGKAFFSRKNFISVVGHDSAVFDTASQLRANGNLKLIDALHYATAIKSGCRFFITHDKDFNSIESNEDITVIRLADIFE